MTVFILTQESDDMIEQIIGVYATKEAAEKGIEAYKAKRFSYGYDFIIKETEVQP